MEYKPLKETEDKKNCLQKFQHQILVVRKSPKLIIAIVFVALFLDNMLLTTIVPIVPEYLWLLKYSSFNGTQFCQQYNLQCDNCTDGQLYRIMHTHARNISDWKKPSSTSLTLSIEERRLIYARQNDSCPNVLKRIKKKKISDESVEIALMFASKALVQLVTNPFVGPLTNRVGYSVPMLAGFVIMFLSTVMFAFSSSYLTLLLARAIQGVGSSFSSVSGLGLLATTFTDDAERGGAFAIALGGLALGVLTGPTFGGILYQFCDKAVPFLLLACLAIMNGALQIFAMKPEVRPEAQTGSSIMKLFLDPYILIAAGAITFGNMGMGILEPSLPLWLKSTMNAQQWEQGMAFLPASVAYLIGATIFGHISHKFGRWASACIGMVLCGIALTAIPFTKTIWQIVPPNFCFGMALGMIDSTMMPIMGDLVDLRHISVYGSVYAISDVAVCLAFTIGPLANAALLRYVGFQWLLHGMAIICFLYAPVVYLLRYPTVINKHNQEKMGLTEDTSPPTYESVDK